MKTIYSLLPLVALAGLTACAADRPSEMHYQCENGQPVMTHIMNDSKIAVQYDGVIHVLQRAPAASGTRYTDANYEWWSKGVTQGTLTPRGGKAIKCDASAPVPE